MRGRAAKARSPTVFKITSDFAENLQPHGYYRRPMRQAQLELQPPPSSTLFLTAAAARDDNRGRDSTFGTEPSPLRRSAGKRLNGW